MFLRFDFTILFDKLNYLVRLYESEKQTVNKIYTIDKWAA